MGAGPQRRRLLLAVAAGHTMLMLLLIAGHGPWAGPVILTVTADHGLNVGDIPVLLVWGAVMWLLFTLDRQ